MSGLALYQLADEHRRMVERLKESTDDPQVIADTIEAESYPLEVKATNTAYAIRELEATVAAIDQAIEQMKERRDAIERRALHVRSYLSRCLGAAGITKVECPHFAITVKKCPPSVEIFQPELVPAQYLVPPEPPEPKPSKKLIGDALKKGTNVPGARLVLSNTRLEIK